jgi:general stress protein CsbA
MQKLLAIVKQKERKERALASVSEGERRSPSLRFDATSVLPVVCTFNRYECSIFKLIVLSLSAFTRYMAAVFMSKIKVTFSLAVMKIILNMSSNSSDDRYIS